MLAPGQAGPLAAPLAQRTPAYVGLWKKTSRKWRDIELFCSKQILSSLSFWGRESLCVVSWFRIRVLSFFRILPPAAEPGSLRAAPLRARASVLNSVGFGEWTRLCRGEGCVVERTNESASVRARLLWLLGTLIVTKPETVATRERPLIRVNKIEKRILS